MQTLAVVLNLGTGKMLKFVTIVTDASLKEIPTNY